MTPQPPTRDLLDWYDPDERRVCDRCGEQAYVRLTDRVSLCFGCGGIFIEGALVARDLTSEEQEVPPDAA